MQITFNSRITSRGPVKDSQRAGCGPGAVQCPGLVYTITLQPEFLKLFTLVEVEKISSFSDLVQRLCVDEQTALKKLWFWR